MKRLTCLILGVVTLVLVACQGGSGDGDSNTFQNQALNSRISSVQPMTGIVFWADNENVDTPAIQLEFSYIGYNDVVDETEGEYDWSGVESLLDQAASRGHQAILRFYFVYPGFETTVPGYIKAMSGYSETKGTSEGQETWFPDWDHESLQAFVLEFYTRLSLQYDDDPRIAFLQTGFGLWGEYHIYDGPFTLGQTFPDKVFQTRFIEHMAGVFSALHWSISIDAADSTYSPFEGDTELTGLGFGLFDDSFMCEDHDDYNTDCWNFFDRSRYLTAPAGGEFSYYTDYDQAHVLDSDGIYGTTFEAEAADFHISYMIGNDQLSYQTLDRIEQAGMATGYAFRITRFQTKDDAAIIDIKNTGTAPIYYDAYVAVNAVRAPESLKGLAPGDTLTCHVASGGDDPVVTIACDRLVSGQTIGYEASLNP